MKVSSIIPTAVFAAFAAGAPVASEDSSISTCPDYNALQCCFACQQVPAASSSYGSICCAACGC
ncbi:uncharacterized protein BO87DRAFT_376301 [Aspergillus neoniger CBS 115656]|uniref:Uncharacterized protein n=1 Tax=Aspergillus neoniger (strain CBS 115656) TaxID=1448310 RepID=A0A318YJ53_ASPNB|nr:hypothetical protein BO87DRAFT_376301 [Aspergillus neoniger CBS 115656]PYH34396.1 hypothetical protein BO87DRAFT_376301 [Aspergillus neoniger CBS 115656]